MEPRTTNTSQGEETVDETVSRIRARLAEAAEAGNASAPNTTSQADPLLEALTSRLTNQSSGISTSATSNLEGFIDRSIRSVQRSGELAIRRLDSERQRELGYARDRASARITGARESQTGYAQQVAALQELTETTQKSVRDLDQRYKEAIMMRDSETAKQVADLQMQKLKFLQEQEEQFFNNMIQATGLAMQNRGLTLQQQRMAEQSEQFWANKAMQEEQFMETMKQTDDQFAKNLALRYDQLNLQEQELEIKRERNDIAWAEYRERKKEIQEEKSQAFTESVVLDGFMAMAREDGLPPDAATAATIMRQSGAFADWEGSAEEFNQIVYEAYTQAKAYRADVEAGAPTPKRSSWRGIPGVTPMSTPPTAAGIPYDQPALEGFLPPEL